MPEPSNVTEQPVTGGDNDLNLDGMNQPVPPAEPSPTPQAVEPQAPTEPAAPDSDFSISTLQNGQKEIRLESGQVYRGVDDAAIIAQLAKAQREASRTITELRKPPTSSPEPVPPQSQIDPTSTAIADMIAPLFGLQNGQQLVQRWNEMNAQINGFQPIAQQTQMNQVAADFVRSTADFEVTPRNSELLGETMDKLGLPLTVENMKFAHYALKGQGLYESPKPADPAPRAPNGQFTSPRMPLAPAASIPTPVAAPDPWAEMSNVFA